MISASIGIPFLNNRATLALAIRSVFAQTSSDWELLLLDDGSTDGSLDIANAVRDSRVRVLTDGVNRGLPARLNELARESASSVVVRMDADDAMVPGRVEMQLAALEAHPDTQVVGGLSYLMNDNEQVYGLHVGPDLEPDPGLFLRLRGGFPFAHPTIAVRRRWFLDNPYDESFRKGQEKELFCRTYSPDTFHKLGVPVLFYREGGRTRLASYVETRRNDRRLLRMYGRSLLGRRRTAAAFGLTIAKESVYYAADRLNAIGALDERIARRRAVKPTGEAIAHAQAMLAQIQATPVPGLDPIEVFRVAPYVG